MRKIYLLLFSLVFLLFGCVDNNLNETGEKNNELNFEAEAEDNENNLNVDSVNESVDIEESENVLNEVSENNDDENDAAVEAEEDEENVPREHRNALRAAENYIALMPFSEKGLYEQLTSEYGDQYPEDAALYAIENLEVDYNEQALKAAETYLEIMPMSDKELFDQLTSEYGDQYTEEQAQYAIDNLED